MIGTAGLARPFARRHLVGEPGREMHHLIDELSEEAIRAVLDAFYARVRRDPELGPVFARAIADDAWPAHMAIIADFWSSVMLKTGRYKRNPFAVHQGVEGLTPALFPRWLALFEETCRERLAPALADAMAERAHRIADSLQAGLFFKPAADTHPGS
jgi:hemoglobin